jgi:hypothetical protein
MKNFQKKMIYKIIFSLEQRQQVKMATLTSSLPHFNIQREIGEWKWNYALEHMKILGKNTFIVQHGPENWLFYLTKKKNVIHRKVKQLSEQKNQEKYGNLLEKQRENIMKLEQNEA